MSISEVQRERERVCAREEEREGGESTYRVSLFLYAEPEKLSILEVKGERKRKRGNA